MYHCSNIDDGKKTKQWEMLLHPQFQVITFSNIIQSKPMANNPSGGYDRYEYPQWSQILGWFIFVLCIIPIPLVYLINYIREYRLLGLKEIVRFSLWSRRKRSMKYLHQSFDVWSSPHRLIQRLVIVFMKEQIFKKNLDFSKQLRKIILLDLIGDRKDEWIK